MDAGEKLQCFAAAKSGTSLFIGTKQNKVYVYDLKNESIKDEVKLEEIPLWLACSDDGSGLAIGGERGVIKLFTYKDDKVSEVQTRVDRTVRSLAMEASGGWLATLSATGKLWAWKCEPGGLVSIPIEASLEASSSMAALSFHGNPTSWPSVREAECVSSTFKPADWLEGTPHLKRDLSSLLRSAIF